jgi:hypothetical protein
MAGKASGRSAGGYALSRTGKAQAQIASEVGVSKVSAHGWMVGNYRPGPAMRAKMRDLYGIPLEAWDEPYGPRRKKPALAVAPAPAPAADVPPPPPSGPIARATSDADEAGGAFVMARSLQRQAQAQLDALEKAGEEWTPAEKAQVMQRLASTVNVLAKLTGQYEMGRRMMRLPIWKQLEFEMFEALRPFPDASRAVAERLETFETRWIGNAG